MHRVAALVLTCLSLTSLAYCQVEPPSSAEKAAARAKRRAEAEAEAEAKNKANREAYIAECNRLRSEHKVKLAKLKAENEAAYERDVSEYNAAKKFREVALDVSSAAVDGRAPTRDDLKYFGARKYRDFAKRFPDTQAAKDAAAGAETFLKGGSPKIPKLPPAPERPSPPTLELMLPPMPEPVPVVYPADLLEEERIERMEEERKTAERTKAAERKWAEEIAAKQRAERLERRRLEEAERKEAAVEAARIKAERSAAEAEARTAFTVATIFVFVMFLMAAAVWSLPILIAFMRGHPDLVAIAAVDLLFGWSFIGWGIALIWSLKAFMRPEFYQGAGHSPPPPPPQADPFGVRPGNPRPDGGNPFDFNN